MKASTLLVAFSAFAAVSAFAVPDQSLITEEELNPTRPDPTDGSNREVEELSEELRRIQNREGGPTDTALYELLKKIEDLVYQVHVKTPRDAMLKHDPTDREKTWPSTQ